MDKVENFDRLIEEFVGNISRFNQTLPQLVYGVLSNLAKQHDSFDFNKVKVLVDQPSLFVSLEGRRLVTRTEDSTDGELERGEYFSIYLNALNRESWKKLRNQLIVKYGDASSEFIRTSLVEVLVHGLKHWVIN